MTRLMEQAIERPHTLPDGAQDCVAGFILHELDEDERWAATTRLGERKLRGLLNRLLNDDNNGRSE
jgi:hypothetical protein